MALPLLCLLLLPAPSFSQQAASNFSQSNPLQDSQAVRDAWRKAYKDFKPGPAVTARIEELKAREREARDLWSAGELESQLEIERLTSGLEGAVGKVLNGVTRWQPTLP